MKIQQSNTDGPQAKAALRGTSAAIQSYFRKCECSKKEHNLPPKTPRERRTDNTQESRGYEIIKMREENTETETKQTMKTQETEGWAFENIRQNWQIESTGEKWRGCKSTKLAVERRINNGHCRNTKDLKRLF